MTVFLSYSSADKKLAERLREELGRRGVSTWGAEVDLSSGTEWKKEMEEAIHSADAILVLVRPNGEADEAQRFTWQEALTAVWQDSEKRIVPILLGDAKVPTFIYSSGLPFQTVGLEDPRSPGATAGAARSIAHLLSRGRNVADFKSRGADPGADRVKVERVAIPEEVESDRSARLSEVRRYAETLKARG
jgi:hypothetical protein